MIALARSVSQLPPNIRAVVPLAESDEISVVSVMTAQPKYLIFTGSEHPKYVVQYGTADQLKRIADCTSELANRLPGCIPIPVTLVSEKSQESILIQQGLPGRPWFNLRSEVRTENDWRVLVERIVFSMNNFQTAVSANPNWKTRHTPSSLLLKTAESYRAIASNTLPKNFSSVVERHGRILEEFHHLPCVFQHGDFCINNFLVAPDRIGIIDFEHFGDAYMPLHDEFILMRSLMHFRQGISENTWEDLWKNMVDRDYYSHAIESKHYSSFFLHFLLWWLLEAEHNPRRQDMGELYFSMLTQFCEQDKNGIDWSPCTYFDY